MEHTFVICAYKESPYLESCIESLKQQTVKSDILLSTATPSQYLENMCKKHDIVYIVRDGIPEISADWNYGLSLSKTAYVTLAHQDDIYESQYVQRVLQCVKENAKLIGTKELIVFTDYYEILEGSRKNNSLNLRIKRILLSVLKKHERQNVIYYKRWVLKYGNAIGCPTVTYNKDYLDDLLKENGRDNLFESNFRSNLDWEAWEWLSKQSGAFVYVPEILMGHRIHESSETSAMITEKKRILEDYEMFRKFWPEWFAKMISRAYKQSENGNRV